MFSRITQQQEARLIAHEQLHAAQARHLGMNSPQTRVMTQTREQVIQRQAHVVPAPQVHTEVRQRQASQVNSGVRLKPSTVVSEMSGAAAIQGGSLKTWSFKNPDVKRIHVVLKSEGRPINADVSLWQGPEHSPYKVCKLCVLEVQPYSTAHSIALIPKPGESLRGEWKRTSVQCCL